MLVLIMNWPVFLFSRYQKHIVMIDRSNETRGMYEKLKSHPNPKVSKKARQFMYSFQVISGGQCFLGLSAK